MNQMTFSDMEYSGRKRITQKEKFLSEMNDIILLRKNSSLWTSSSPKTSGTPCTHINWPSAATKSGSWRSVSNGAYAAHG